MVIFDNVGIPESIALILVFGGGALVLIVSVFMFFTLFPNFSPRQRGFDARTFIEARSCDALNADPVGDMATRIHDLLRWITNNPDELAILKVLDCADCDRVRELVTLIGRGDTERGKRRLRRNIQGSERDRLAARLEECDV